MTIQGLLSTLFNLGAQTDFWNSNRAARDFWLVFAAAVVVAIVYFTLRAVRNRRRHAHQHPFGRSL